jgi:hypothetical protein
MNLGEKVKVKYNPVGTILTKTVVSSPLVGPAPLVLRARSSSVLGTRRHIRQVFRHRGISGYVSLKPQEAPRRAADEKDGDNGVESDELTE